MPARVEAGENSHSQAEKIETSLLSEIELRVCLFKGQGLTNREVGRRLEKSRHTVKNHLNSVYRKLQVDVGGLTLLAQWALFATYLEKKDFTLEEVGQKFLELARNRFHEKSVPILRLNKLLREVSEAEAQAKADAFPLTPKQLEILELLAEGKTRKEIAQEQEVAPVTIYHHFFRPPGESPGSGGIFARLGVDNVTDAIKKARELGLLEPEETPTTFPSHETLHESNEAGG